MGATRRILGATRRIGRPVGFWGLARLATDGGLAGRAEEYFCKLFAEAGLELIDQRARRPFPLAAAASAPQSPPPLPRRRRPVLQQARALLMAPGLSRTYRLRQSGRQLMRGGGGVHTLLMRRRTEYAGAAQLPKGAFQGGHVCAALICELVATLK